MAQQPSSAAEFCWRMRRRRHAHLGSDQVTSRSGASALVATMSGLRSVALVLVVSLLALGGVRPNAPDPMTIALSQLVPLKPADPST